MAADLSGSIDFQSELTPVSTGKAIIEAMSCLLAYRVVILPLPKVTKRSLPVMLQWLIQ